MSEYILHRQEILHRPDLPPRRNFLAVPATENFYTLLEVPPTASSIAIRASYNRLIIKLKADRKSNPTSSQSLKNLEFAYQTLISPILREEYDLANPQPFSFPPFPSSVPPTSPPPGPEPRQPRLFTKAFAQPRPSYPPSPSLLLPAGLREEAQICEIQTFSKQRRSRWDLASLSLINSISSKKREILALERELALILLEEAKSLKASKGLKSLKGFHSTLQKLLPCILRTRREFQEDPFHLSMDKEKIERKLRRLKKKVENDEELLVTTGLEVDAIEAADEQEIEIARDILWGRQRVGLGTVAGVGRGELVRILED